MKNLIKKIVGMYAKSSTNTCFWLLIHQPKAPKSLIEK